MSSNRDLDLRALIDALAAREIEVVIVGSLAVTLYEGPVSSGGVELAVSVLAVDSIIELMYAASFVLIATATDTDVTILTQADAANDWVVAEKPGSLTFVAAPAGPLAEKERQVGFEAIRPDTRLSFLYEPSVPFWRLIRRARKVRVPGGEWLVASPIDLIAIETARRARRGDGEVGLADSAVEFLRGLPDAEQ